MSQAVSFEVDTYQSNRWVLECVLDDKDMALSTAKRLYDSKRFSAVRVVQETFDEDSNSSRERVIFETTVADRDNRAAKQQASPAKVDRSERQALKKRPRQATKPAAKTARKNGPSLWVLLLWLIAILAGGATLLYYLQRL
ncbi:hypothetical protein WH96_00375 [Kiloniella spongiae]|uniref:Uncharacterized protein n=1 Tax=Kiloniella spongiae TaxID=1489064 RepID=A0A0H2MIP4_9PROT|nr:hypothetical protein [Kiloniella spongiae]KLN62041.1 hypothetical protein WH96_00375 [Kiloniella spongiae]